jgi:iron(III) transport system ATP-binding protein
VYVTHDQAEAVVLGDRIGVVRAGKLLQIATPDQIYNRPADLFVASFTGASNLLPGRVVARNGELGIVEAQNGQCLTAWLSSGVQAGETVKIAVRPENVRLGGGQGFGDNGSGNDGFGGQGFGGQNFGGNGSTGANRFTARVTGHRFQGTQTIYELAALGGRLEAIELGTSMRHAIGSELDLVLPPALCWAYPFD